jgi:hypothetical protein
MKIISLVVAFIAAAAIAAPIDPPAGKLAQPWIMSKLSAEME